MYDESDIMLHEEEILKDITDPVIKKDLLELKKLQEDWYVENLRVAEYKRLPNSFRRSVSRLFSQKDPSVLRYLLYNIDFLRAFSRTEIGYGALDSVFKALSETFNILRVYRLFSEFPDDFFNYYVDKFGCSHNYYLNEYISLNLEHSQDPSGFNSRFDYWKVNIFICDTSLEELPAFYKTNYYKSEAVLALRNLIISLNKWVQGGFAKELLNKSLAIPILEKLRENSIPNIDSVIKKYLNQDKVLVKTNLSSLEEKKITVYRGRVASIKNIPREEIKSGNYKGIVFQNAEIRFILKDVLIIPSFKNPHELSEEDVEFEMDRLEVITFLNYFKENPFEVGNLLYCYGKVSGTEFNLAIGGGYDLLKFKKLKEYQINEDITLKYFNDRVSYVYMKGKNVAKFYSEKGIDDAISIIQKWEANNYRSKLLPTTVIFPVLRKLYESNWQKFRTPIREEFKSRFSESDGQARRKLMWYLPKNKELFTIEELRFFKSSR